MTSVREQAAELLPCDIVMAGGVTSGIIYPGAVAMISRRYAFHSIGGTSVGAIAAAVTAAAEYGRRTGANVAAFDAISGLAASLGDSAPDGRSRLFHLFTPETRGHTNTRPLMALLMPLIRPAGMWRKLIGLAGAALRMPLVAIPSLLAVAAVIVAAAFIEAEGAALIVAMLAALALILLVFVLALCLALKWRWLPAFVRNGYGICTGNASPAFSTGGTLRFDGLTPWMHALVQSMAGRGPDDRPLTFGELWAAPGANGPGEAWEGPHSPRAIELTMITSDISRNRTMQTPFLETPSPLYFQAETMRRYFPERIVREMTDRCGDYDDAVAPIEGVYRLPWPQHIPIVFCARLSLSFPVLLSAVPLLTPDFSRKDENGKIPLRPVWFSDGGLTSNFPVHFFDSPVPSRPTFCLNLVAFDASLENAAEARAAEGDPAHGEVGDPAAGETGASVGKAMGEANAPERRSDRRPPHPTEADLQPGKDVWKFIQMPRRNELMPVPFSSFGNRADSGIVSFLATLVETARFWSDNQMLIAPGVRERVVHIGLRDDEGGLNFDMARNVIDDLDLRGRAAGMLVAARFDPAVTVDPETGGANAHAFPNHRWVRFRNFMAGFEDISLRFLASRRASAKAAAGRGEPAVEAMIDGMAEPLIGYPAPAKARPYFHAATARYEEFSAWLAKAQRDDPAATFDRRRSFTGEAPANPAGAAPRPKMRLRLRPLADNDPRAQHCNLPEDPVEPPLKPPLR